MLLAWALPAPAHDVPGETRAHAFAKVEGDRLHVLLRLPLALLLNVDLPKQGPGYLALGQIDEGLGRAIAAADREIGWFEGDRRLPLASGRARVSLPSDKSFSGFDAARALVGGPRLPETAYVFWNQGYVDAHLEYAIESPNSVFSVDFRIAPALRDRVRLDLRYLPPSGGERAFDLATAGEPVMLDPRWHQAAWTFLQSGFRHILQGPDHLLFLLCLILPFRRVDGYLVGVVSAFTVAHSITLISASYGVAPSAAWFMPLVETLIAASILFMAIENVLKPWLQRRWVTSALFGLVHGFGFSSMLQDQLQFAGSSLLVSLLAFNVGVEIGQLLLLLAVLPVLAAWRAATPATARAIDIVICALAAHVAWHWTVERGEALQASLEPGQAWWWLVIALSAVLLLATVLGWSARGLLASRRRSADVGNQPAANR